MAARIESTIAMIRDLNAHLAAGQVAAFVDRTADDDELRRIASHLASCAECRAEVADAVDIVAEIRQRRTRPVWIAGVAGVAAAALVAMIVWPRGIDQSTVHREAPVTTTIAPAAVHPVGITSSAPTLVWTAVPHADRYRVRVFTADGSVIWERESTDTVLAFPASGGLRDGQTYYWKVEAQIGFDRTVASELIQFSVRFAP